MKEQLTALLKNEMKPALGVTEVGAIALATASAFSAIGGTLLSIKLSLNGGMYKNAFSCAIPNTEELGNEMAAVLGALGGDATLGLQVLQPITKETVAQAHRLFSANENLVTISVLPTEQIYIGALVETTKGTGRAIIENFHWNITKVYQNDTLVWEGGKTPLTPNQEPLDFDTLSIQTLFDYCKTVPIEDISFLEDMIAMNERLAKEGAKGVGLAIEKTLGVYRQKGIVGEDGISHAQRLTCNAMDARLAGLPFPAMSIAGSGSHGILCSMPVVSFGKTNENTKEEVLRALALSALVTVYSKHYTGRLSPLCGCVLGGGSGAACGIVFLMGGTAKQVGDAINLMSANLTGMICDGGSTGCVLKASAGVYSAFLSAMLAVNGVAIPPHFGIIGSTVEQTIYNLGKVSNDGMGNTDATTIAIMQSGK